MMAVVLAFALILFSLVQAATIAGYLYWRYRALQERRLRASEVLSNLRTSADPGSREVMHMLDGIVEHVFTHRELAIHLAPIDDMEGVVAFLHSLAGVIELHCEESAELMKELDSDETVEEG